MLDTETKRRIDTARDILVGKVPDPKSQVEQITIALIYKFMDDMDAEAAELGGKRKFFTGEFAAYGWAQLMKKAGNDKLLCYSEGITKMTENTALPELFRSIFKNAYLPYRDPETLNAFLKIIDEFSYDHSERLGDAFEYLLSVLGSQGDAGQFRTPRHIIDFMVEVLAPQKNETILDPACGTAGFLISAYKHILRSNDPSHPSNQPDPSDPAKRPVKPLTPDEKGRLAKNFKGYDISPDMVRLSLVNLYLHGFTDPHIYEYDSLTSEERWNEFADVILANPPFMSPKGGIKPHKRFSIQAKRSEVLFVDYMAEHLTPTGRAAIIVPEGIIFQSQTAYTELRRLLVENSLVAVVSLPAGVFNPYAGVKTSILILDKSLAKQSDTIGFFKVEADGFGLGAQRRAIEKNDLPQVQAELTAYLNALRSKSSIESILAIASTAQIVPKEKLAANGDYNLSGERYREGALAIAQWPFVRLGDLFETKSGTTPSRSNPAYFANGTIPWVKTLDLTDGPITATHEKITKLALAETHLSILPVGTVLVAMYGGFNQIGRTGVLEIEAVQNQAMTALLPTPEVNPYFLNAVLTGSKDHWKKVANSTRKDPNITKSHVLDFALPLPPLEVQKEIVAEIKGYQKVINGARAVLDHYRPHIPIHPDWLMVPIGDLVESILLGLVRNKAEQDPKHPNPYVKMNNITNDGALDLTDLAFVDASPEELKRLALHDGDFIYNTRNAPDLVGKSAVFHGKSGTHLFNNNILRIRFGPRALPDFVNTVMNSDYGKAKIRAQVDGTTSVAALYQKNYLAIEIPLPPLATQQAIVAEIEAEQALVAANRELITRFEQKIQATLARIWGEKSAQDDSRAVLE